MKRRRIDHPERRRSTVELNLAEQSKLRSVSRPAGCASILSRLGLVIAIIAALATLGLR